MYLIGDRGLEACSDDLMVLLLVVRNTAARASQSESWPDDEGELANLSLHARQSKVTSHARDSH